MRFLSRASANSGTAGISRDRGGQRIWQYRFRIDAPLAQLVADPHVEDSPDFERVLTWRFRYGSVLARLDPSRLAPGPAFDVWP